MKRIIIVLIVLSVALNVCSQNDLKVMSFNIRYSEAHDGTNSWKYRRDAVVEMIKDQQPAVFGLQEALNEQIIYIRSNCKQYVALGVGREDGKEDGEHMEVFYNQNLFTLLDWHTFWLSETPDTPSKGWDAACKRTATWVKLQSKADGRKFYFVDTHLDHVGEVARRNGLSLIVDSIGALNKENYPMILVGDFNVSPDDGCLTELNRRMKSARLTAEITDNAPTFHDWGKRGEWIDYIYYKGFERCKEYKVMNKRYNDTPYVSDHNPITAIIVW